MRVDLPDNGWAEIAEPSELRNGDRKAVLKSLTVEVGDDGKSILSLSYDDEMRDALLRRIVRNWSLPFPLPKDDSASLDKLTIAQADALAKAIKPHMDLVNGVADPTKRGTDPTPALAS